MEMVDRKKQCPVQVSCPQIREEYAPTIVSPNKNNYNSIPLQSTTTKNTIYIVQLAQTFSEYYTNI